MDQNTKIKILLTNDDGCFAEGLNALFDAFTSSENQQKYHIVAIAPNSNRSGVGTALNLINPIEINKIKQNFYSLDANPLDCVILARNGILEIFDDLQFSPDLVISGINNGSNFSQAVWSSGTVSAALYASQVYKIPSLAVSLAYDYQRFFSAQHNYENAYSQKNYQQAAEIIVKIVENINIKNIKNNNFLLNINIPNEITSNTKIKLSKFINLQDFEKPPIIASNSPRKHNLFWLPTIQVNKNKLLQNSPDSDIVMVMQNHISITPLNINSSNSEEFKYLEEIKI